MAAEDLPCGNPMMAPIVLRIISVVLYDGDLYQYYVHMNRYYTYRYIYIYIYIRSLNPKPIIYIYICRVKLTQSTAELSLRGRVASRDPELSCCLVGNGGMDPLRVPLKGSIRVPERHL